MDNNKLICPVKRLEENKSSIGLKIDLRDEDMNIKVDITTKNIIKSIIDFINKKLSN